jgi:tetratricopeptide (TPR) repeat protein
MAILALTYVLVTLVSMSQADLEPGRELRKQGKIEEAIAFFQESLVAEPDSPEALRELGHSFALAGRYPEAIETYAQLASQNLRWQLEGAKWTGLAHLYLGNVEASLEQSRLEERLAAQLGETSAGARAARQIGYVYTELGQFGSANTAFVSALNGNPNDIDTLYLVGVLAARQGDWGSLRYQVLDLEPLVAHSHNPDRSSLVDHLKAELAVSRGDEEEALELLDTTGSPNATLYLEARARAYDHQGDLAKAEATYRSILDSTDDRLEFPLVYVKALLGMAKILDALGRREEAASAYRRFLEHWGSAAGPLPGVVDARSRLELLERQP